MGKIKCLHKSRLWLVKSSNRPVFNHDNYMPNCNLSTLVFPDIEIQLWLYYKQNNETTKKEKAPEQGSKPWGFEVRPRLEGHNKEQRPLWTKPVGKSSGPLLNHFRFSYDCTQHFLLILFTVCLTYPLTHRAQFTCLYVHIRKQDTVITLSFPELKCSWAGILEAAWLPHRLCHSFLLSFGLVVCGWLAGSADIFSSCSNYDPRHPSGSGFDSHLNTNIVQIQHFPDVVPPLTAAGTIFHMLYTFLFARKHCRSEQGFSPELNWAEFRFVYFLAEEICWENENLCRLRVPWLIGRQEGSQTLNWCSPAVWQIALTLIGPNGPHQCCLVTFNK